MPAPTTVLEYLELLQKSGVLDDKKLEAYLSRLRAGGALPTRPMDLAALLVRDGVLTHFQAEQILQGKWKRFTIGKYKVLEKLGSGGMGSVFLAEHKLMRRRVAVKVLPTAKAEDPSSLERFYREARAVAALDHPNIVRAYDIDQDDKLHFLVMEYVDGASLQEIVKRSGPLDPVRAAHYIRQSALGLQHAHESAGLVHRDVKPGNILVDRTGTVKVLDMGLARFFHDEEDILTKKYDENVLGTADYLAPEQALDSHTVDIRADIYSLGATFYFCLTGKTPFTEGTVAQKLIWHQTKHPRPVRSFRTDVPEELVAVIERMMAKDPAQRYQTPLEVVEALTPWTQTPIGLPTEAEMPRLSPAALGDKPPSESQVPTLAPRVPGLANPAPRPGMTLPAGALAPGSTPTPRPARSARGSAAPLPPVLPGVTAATAPVRNGQPPALPPLEPPGAEPAEEEGDPWQRLAPETEDPARPDTDRGGTAPSGRRSSVSRTLPPVRVRPWWEVVLVGLMILGAVLAAATALGVWLVTRPATTSGPGEAAPVLVSRSGDHGTVPNVRAALALVKPGGRIVLQDPVEEQIVLDGAHCPRGITIEGESGKDVVWSAPKSTDGIDALIGVKSTQDLRLRNLTIDGGGRYQKLFLFMGPCPGTALENLTLRGFQRCGVLVMNCAGAAGRPVTFRGLNVLTTKGAEAGLLFDLNKSMQDVKDNNHFLIQDCHVEGPCKKPILQVKPVQHLDLRP